MHLVRPALFHQQFVEIISGEAVEPDRVLRSRGLRLGHNQQRKTSPRGSKHVDQRPRRRGRGRDLRVLKPLAGKPGYVHTDALNDSG
jgi:hypothetical protein